MTFPGLGYDRRWAIPAVPVLLLALLVPAASTASAVDSNGAFATINNNVYCVPQNDMPEIIGLPGIDSSYGVESTGSNDVLFARVINGVSQSVGTVGAGISIVGPILLPDGNVTAAYISNGGTLASVTVNVPANMCGDDDGDNIANYLDDSDGDGVSDLLDLCPNTPTGTPVDSTGCPIVVDPISVEPALVTFSDGAGTLTVPAQPTGVSVTKDGVVIDPGTYPATGTVSGGYVVADGYTLNGPATWSHTFPPIVPPVDTFDGTKASGYTGATWDGSGTSTITPKGEFEVAVSLYLVIYSVPESCDPSQYLESCVPQTRLDVVGPVTTDGTKATTSTVKVPKCGNYQWDWTANAQPPTTLTGHLRGYLFGGIVLQDKCGEPPTERDIVTPVTPTVTHEVITCTADYALVTTKGSISVPVTQGLKYLLDSKVVTGVLSVNPGTYVFTAQVTSNEYVLSDTAVNLTVVVKAGTAPACVKPPVVVPPTNPPVVTPAVPSTPVVVPAAPTPTPSSFITPRSVKTGGEGPGNLRYLMLLVAGCLAAAGLRKAKPASDRLAR